MQRIRIATGVVTSSLPSRVPITAERTCPRTQFPLIDVKGAVPSRGAFTQRIATGAKFTGSWNCHGVVWQGP